MRTRIFTYGTLMKGYGNDYLLKGEDTVFLGDAVTEPGYTLYQTAFRFPAVYEGGDTAIRGEVYEVSGETLARIDRLEGVSDNPSYEGHYLRKPVRLTNGTVAQIYVYPAGRPTGRLTKIESGDWREYMRQEHGHYGDWEGIYHDYK